MFYSEKYNLLFIESPKTGTRSILESLEKIDPNGARTELRIDKKTITGKDLIQGIMGHAKAKEFKKALGDKSYNKLETIAFIRHPYSKLVSSYFFMKKSSLKQSFLVKGSRNRIMRGTKYFISSLLPKILPFKIWAFIYPYKSNSSYILDYDGKRIVKHIGRTEFLDSDFQQIMSNLGIDTKNIKVPKKNTSIHDSYKNYFTSNWFKREMYKKMKFDIDLYNDICKELDGNENILS